MLGIELSTLFLPDKCLGAELKPQPLNITLIMVLNLEGGWVRLGKLKAS